MTARVTLTELIETLRGLTDAGTADYTLGTVVFWDGIQLQKVLDRHVERVQRAPLTPVITYNGGSAIYQEYTSGLANFEQTDGGTAVFVVEDSTGLDAGTALWSADYLNGVVTFAANTLGTAYYLTGRSYNLNAAAADVWRHKAAQAAKRFNFSTDNHSVSANQVYEHCMDQARRFEGLAGPTVSMLYRSDMV